MCVCVCLCPAWDAAEYAGQDSASRATCQWFSQRGLPAFPTAIIATNPTQPHFTPPHVLTGSPHADARKGNATHLPGLRRRALEQSCWLLAAAGFANFRGRARTSPLRARMGNSIASAELVALAARCSMNEKLRFENDQADAAILRVCAGVGICYG